MLLYLTQTTLLLFLILVVYKLVLENQKIHVFKRYYLVFALVLAFLLPLIKIPTTGVLTLANMKLQELNEISITPEKATASTSLTIITLQYVLLGLYLLGFGVMLTRFIASLLHFKRLEKQGSIIYDQGQKFVVLNHLDTAFTFRNTIYLPLNIPIEWNNKILLHEYNHVKQKHSWDILLIESLKIVFWFQPLLYWYQQNIALNHEFLADDTLNSNPAETQAYLQLLVSQTYKQNEQRFSSSFNFNLTKKRFIMLTKSNNPMKNAFASMGAIALLCTMSTYTVFAQSKPQEPVVTKATPAIEDPNEVHIAVSEPASYPGGMMAFNQDFIANFETPPFEGESLRVILQFIIEKDGSLNEIKVVRDPGFGTKEAALKAISKTKNWIPAVDKGKVVRSQFTLPITLQAEQTTETEA
ncbi:M56 family metallopeptidase [Myroides odoratus]|uniref:M56 family metallopeptidase n=1 Tax=Myroides odoratus TaxID=256 RepID=UPI0039B11AB5